MNSEPSRRQLLTLGGVVLGVGCVELALPNGSALAALSEHGTGQITLEALPTRPVPVLSPDGTAPAAVPRQLAVKVINEGVTLPQGTQMTISFSERLYAVMIPPMIFFGGRRVKTTASTSLDATTGLTDCVITFGEQIPLRTIDSGDLIALLGTVNPCRFPLDLTRPVAPTASIRATPRSPAAHCELRSPRPSSFGGAVTPWGVAVAAGWDRHVWGEDDRYYYYRPVRVSLTGVGPGKSPAAEFMIITDPRVVTNMSVVSARLNNRSYSIADIAVAAQSSTDTIRQVHWRTPVELAADDRLDVELKMTAGNPTGPLSTITHPEVSAAMINIAARQTTRMSVARTDSVWQ
ncbi:MAG: hypothetical protein QG608_3533 [Actinomycetota bacterium]|nr:hypothetical protein [Actinomycetota bacterium]